MLGIPLRILNVEDSEDDARLLARHLTKAGYDVTFERVETPAALQSALDRERWDVVVADYMLPGFSAPAAVALLKRRADHPPVVIVSGAVHDDIMAMEALRNGARDYLAKTYLSRLIPAIGLAAGVLAERERPAAHLTLCQEYMELPAPNLAKAVFHGEQALEGAAEWNLPEIYALAALCLGTCYVQMGWAGDAVKVLQAVPPDETDDPFESHMSRAEYFLLTGNPALAVREAIAALQVTGRELVRSFQVYNLLMRCARVQGHHKDALNFAISARVVALEAQRHELAFRATQAFSELYLSLGPAADRLVQELEQEYRANGVNLAAYIGPMQAQAKEGRL